MSALYKVIVEETRETEFWVRADSLEAAREDAEILAEELDDRDWHDGDFDVEVVPEPGRPKRRVRFWTGGPSGDWAIFTPEEAAS